MTLSTGNSRIKDIIIMMFFLVLCVLFYVDGLSVTALELSSDQWNFLPISMKMAQPELFASDLFMADLDDVEYYTPWFINGILFFSWVNGGDHIQGANIFHLLVQLVYCFGWFAVLRIFIKNIWVAAVVTLLMRGIMWPPGNELWGISGLWTFLPRTVYTAFLSLPVLFFIKSIFKDYARREFLLATFLLGLVSNFHAISGLTCGLAFLIAFVLHAVFCSKYGTIKAIRLFCLGLLVFFIGLSPFIITYVGKVISTEVANPELFRELLTVRIGSEFLKPFGVLQRLLELKWILFLGVPLLSSVILIKFLRKPLAQLVRFFVILFLVVMGMSLVIVPAESLVNNLLGADLKVAFQLVRGIKYLILPVFLLVGMFMDWSFGFLTKNAKYPATLGGGLFITFLLMLFISRSGDLNVPLLRDDILRGQLPDAVTHAPYLESERDGLHEAIDWIKLNTDINDSFIGPSTLRVGAERSVIHDFKGGSMLIEGNPDKYVQWALREEGLDRLTTEQEKAEQYAKWGADYLLTDIESEISFPVIRQFQKWTLYKINPDD